MTTWSEAEVEALCLAVADIPSITLTKIITTEKSGPLVVEDFSKDKYTLRNHKTTMEAVLDSEGKPVIRFVRQEPIPNPNYQSEIDAWQDKHPIMQRLNGRSQPDSD